MPGTVDESKSYSVSYSAIIDRKGDVKNQTTVLHSILFSQNREKIELQKQEKGTEKI